MSSTRGACFLGHVRVLTSFDGNVYEHEVNSEGIEQGEPLSVRQTSDTFRIYRCVNCGYECDGSEDFTIRSHLGKMHELVDSFVVE